MCFNTTTELLWTYTSSYLAFHHSQPCCSDYTPLTTICFLTTKELLWPYIVNYHVLRHFHRAVLTKHHQLPCASSLPPSCSDYTPVTTMCFLTTTKLLWLYIVNYHASPNYHRAVLTIHHYIPCALAALLSCSDYTLLDTMCFLTTTELLSLNTSNYHVFHHYQSCCSDYTPLVVSSLLKSCSDHTLLTTMCFGTSTELFWLNTTNYHVFSHY